jgi:hypothetical protein
MEHVARSIRIHGFDTEGRMMLNALPGSAQPTGSSVPICDRNDLRRGLFGKDPDGISGVNRVDQHTRARQ